MDQKIDVEIQDEGTIFLLRPVTETGKSWIESNISDSDGYQPYWPIVVVEHRYIDDIVFGMGSDGLKLKLK